MCKYADFRFRMEKRGSRTFHLHTCTSEICTSNLPSREVSALDERKWYVWTLGAAG